MLLRTGHPTSDTLVSKPLARRMTVEMPRPAQPTPGRLAFLVRDLGLGGVGRSTLRLARHFLERGVAVDLVLEKDKGPLRSLIPEGAEVTVLGSGEPYWRTKLMMLRSDAGGLAPFIPAVMRRD